MTPAAPLAVAAAAPCSPLVRGAPGLPIFSTPEMQTGESQTQYHETLVLVGENTQLFNALATGTCRFSGLSHF